MKKREKKDERKRKKGDRVRKRRWRYNKTFKRGDGWRLDTWCWRSVGGTCLLGSELVLAPDKVSR